MIRLNPEADTQNKYKEVTVFVFTYLVQHPRSRKTGER